MARRLADEANRASVAIYCLDSRGLAVGPAMPDDWADISQEGPFSQSNRADPTVLTRQMRYMASQDVPAMLAAMTGGLLFHDVNNLGEALHQIAADQSDCYLLGWNPGEKAFDFRNGQSPYHSIRIKVRRPGIKVRSRVGFFGVPSGQNPHFVSARRRMLADLNSPLRDEDIAVDLTASFQISNTFGPHIESLLHVSPQNVDFTPDNRGCRVARLELAIAPQHLTPISNLLSRMVN